MTINTDTIEAHIPYYLTRPQKEGLLKALADFKASRNVDYYIHQYPDEVLQGDGWAGLEIISFENGDRNQIRGVVLSNTCDISTDNPRQVPAKLVFAPIVKLSRYAQLLNATELSPQQVDDKLRAIREQNVTTLFYLPLGGDLDDEYVAVLDDVHSIPSHAFQDSQVRRKIFTLSMFGFYIFLLKLSVHFCRFQEEVAR